MFKVGQKVVCINASGFGGEVIPLSKDCDYLVRAVRDKNPFGLGIPQLLLEGVINESDDGFERGYGQHRFRPSTIHLERS